jgi:putative oxidoreductase
MTAAWAESLYVLGRVLIGALFATAGIRHAFIFQSVLDMMRQRGIPAAAAVLVVGSLFQTLAGVALMAGWQVPAAAFGLILFTVAATLMLLDFWAMHGPEREMAQSAALANVAIVGGLLVTAAHALAAS